MEKMKKALNEDFSCACNRYLRVAVDTTDVDAVADALVRLDIPAYQVQGYKDGNHSVSFVVFKGEPGIGTKLSLLLKDTLIFEEDAWDNTYGKLLVNGEKAIRDVHYSETTLALLRDNDDPRDTEKYFETEFSIKRPNGTVFVSGGAGMVHEKYVKSYLSFSLLEKNDETN